MKKSRRRPALPAPTQSAALLVHLPPSQVGMFRFLLEAHGHLALFTVLDRREAFIKVLFSPHQTAAVHAVLQAIATEVELVVHPWPKAHCEECSTAAKV